MIITTARLVIKYSIQNFFRNFWLSVVAMTVMTASIVSLTSIFVMSGIGVHLVDSISQKVDISLYFPATMSQTRASEIKTEIEKLPETKSVTLVSSKEALERFASEHKDDEFVVSSLAELDGNPLGPIVTIQAYSLDDYPSLISSLDELGITKIAQEVDYQDRVAIIEKLKHLNQKVQLLALVLTILFALISALTVINTIRLGIYSHRDEIGVMKLVGATNAFVRAPYILDGIVYAFLSLILSWVLLFAFAKGFSSQLSTFFEGTDFSVYAFLHANAPALALGEFIVFSILNVLAAALALRRYLHV